MIDHKIRTGIEPAFSDNRSADLPLNYSIFCPVNIYECTSNARRYDSLDPRLKVVKSCFSVSLTPKSLNRSRSTQHSALTQPSMSMVTTMNFNRLGTHLHDLREIVSIFQTLDREPFSYSNNTHRHSFTRSSSKKTSASKERSQF